MTVHEPITMATDYLLAIASLIFAALLWRRSSRAWVLMFLFTATGSFFGGTFHGLGPAYGPFATALLWKATVYSVGLAAFFLIVAAVPRGWAAIIALLMFIVYGSWMITHTSFLWVVIDYGVAYVVIAAVHAVLWLRTRSQASPWIVLSFVVAVVAAGLQQSSVAIGRMNHNDVYHLVQLVALWFLYRGAAFMTTASVQSTTEAT